MTALTAGLRRYTANSTGLYLTRIFLALAGAAAFPQWLQQIIWTLPLTLGVVAAALADTDDRFTGRLRNLLITLLCFCIASVSVELLFPIHGYLSSGWRSPHGDLFCWARLGNVTPPSLSARY